MSGALNFEPIVCRFVVVVIGAYLVLDCKVVPSNNKHRPDRQKCTRPRKAQLITEEGFLVEVFKGSPCNFVALGIALVLCASVNSGRKKAYKCISAVMNCFPPVSR